MPGRIAVLAAAFALLEAPMARTQDVEPHSLTADIPAEPLAEALAAFANQTGLQVVYISGVVDRQRSSPTRAGEKPKDALPRLLRGTGLTFEYLTAHSVRIIRNARPRKAFSVNAEDLPNDIIVTANRRNEAIQNVPITIQVLSGATLENLNAKTFDDFVSYLPGVTAHGVGPAQNSIYMRGLGTTEFGNQAAGSGGIFPNVAIYLDEQSAQLPGRNLDVYAADMQRIEVLEGPQGTLFGAGAEAGVIRYLTNKPKLDVAEGAVDAHYAITAHGDPSTAVEAVINLPLLQDTFAVRGVIYDERRGGYIDNIPATFARLASDASIRYADYSVGGVAAVPPNSVVINNAALVAKNINSVTYQGIRLEGLYQFNESWKVLLSQSYQAMEADGVFAETTVDSLGAPQPALTTQLFNPSYDKDRFENTALTVNGRVGALEMLYAGAFSVRNVEQLQDYTNYARGGPYADYYQCANPGRTAATAQCFSPSSTWRDIERNTHESHEFRVSTPVERGIRAIGGLFYEDYRIQDQSDWFYLTALPYFEPIAPPTGYFVLDGKVLPGGASYGTNAVFVPASATSNNPNVRPLGDSFFNDNTRGYDQRAVFTSVEWDLVPHTLTLTTGTRYFSTVTSEVGSVVGSSGCTPLVHAPVPDPCVDRDSTDLNSLGFERHYSGFRSRGSLSWTVSDSAMVYAAWSQGFRAGGFNRGFPIASTSPLSAGPGSWQAVASAHGGWTLPLAYVPDNLTNTEVGWRLRWFEGRLQWNGTLYREDWTHAQVVGAGAEFGAAGAAINGGTYRVRGIETSAGLQITTGFRLDGGMAWNHARLVEEATYYWNDGTPIEFNALRNENGSKVENFGGTLNSPLAGAPPFQGNLRARYEVEVESARVSLQFGVVHQAHSLANTGNVSEDQQFNVGVYDLAAFTTFQGALGLAKDHWTVQAYGENLSDERAQLFANYYNYVKAVTVNRPRTLGVRLNYKFGL